MVIEILNFIYKGPWETIKSDKALNDVQILIFPKDITGVKIICQCEINKIHGI
jgi:hypothetical protein